MASGKASHFGGSLTDPSDAERRHCQPKRIGQGWRAYAGDPDTRWQYFQHGEHRQHRERIYRFRRLAE
jgi:hypothetical protein